MRAVERTTLPIAKLKAAPYNPRRISDRALEGLQQSVQSFGLVQEIVVNRRPDGSFVIVGGHQRVKVLQTEGEIDAPVAIVELNPTEERTLNVSLNNPAISGEFTENLQPILAELASADRALFEALRLDDLEKAIPMPKTPPDEFPAFAEDIATEYCCPKCGYRWSGATS